MMVIWHHRLSLLFFRIISNRCLKIIIDVERGAFVIDRKKTAIRSEVIVVFNYFYVVK